MNSLFRSLKFRLTAWYAFVFTLSLVAVFASLDMFLRRSAMKQVDLFLASEAGRLADLAGRRKPQIIQAEVDRFARHYGEDKVLLRILYPGGTPPVSSDSASWTNTTLLGKVPATVMPGTPAHVTAGVSGRRDRSIYAAYSGGLVVHISCSLADHDRTVRTFRLILLVGLVMTLLSGTVLAWLLMHRAMSRIEEVRAAAVNISGGDFSRRVLVGRHSDEISGLATAFNGMIGKIDALMTELRGVTDNIAHELRTPITRMRGHLEPYLAEKAADGELRETITLVVEECDHMSHTINVMLQIARLEAGSQCLAREPVELRKTIQQAAEAFDLMVVDKALQLELRLPEAQTEIIGDRSSLQRMLSNLLDNAIRYTEAGGHIMMSCRTVGKSCELVVEDSGVGISETDLPHIYDRFYRATNSSRHQGTGLGLCLVRAIVHAHGGTIAVQSQLGKGTRFAILLPSAI